MWCGRAGALPKRQRSTDGVARGPAARAAPGRVRGRGGRPPPGTPGGGRGGDADRACRVHGGREPPSAVGEMADARPLTEAPAGAGVPAGTSGIRPGRRCRGEGVGVERRRGAGRVRHVRPGGAGRAPADGHMGSRPEQCMVFPLSVVRRNPPHGIPGMSARGGIRSPAVLRQAYRRNQRTRPGDCADGVRPLAVEVVVLAAVNGRSTTYGAAQYLPVTGKATGLPGG